MINEENNSIVNYKEEIDNLNMICENIMKKQFLKMYLFINIFKNLRN